MSNEFNLFYEVTCLKRPLFLCLKGDLLILYSILDLLSHQMAIAAWSYGYIVGLTSTNAIFYNVLDGQLDLLNGSMCDSCPILHQSAISDIFTLKTYNVWYLLTAKPQLLWSLLCVFILYVRTIGLRISPFQKHSTLRSRDVAPLVKGF